MTEHPDPSTCPLCGQPNECAIAAGRAPETCWCISATIDPSVLKSIPPEAQGRVCICSRCASARAVTEPPV